MRCDQSAVRSRRFCKKSPLVFAAQRGGSTDTTTLHVRSQAWLSLTIIAQAVARNWSGCAAGPQRPLDRQGSLIVPASARCLLYNRLSMAEKAIAQCASNHRESCEISILSLTELEKYYRDAVKARDNIRAGRPVRPYPPDIIQR
jgi:hypothetical protein